LPEVESSVHRRWLKLPDLARVPSGGAGELVWVGLVLAVFLLQRFAVSILHHDGAQADFRRAIYFITTAALILLALHFRRFVGAWLLALGIALNFIPMASYGGLMPVSYEHVVESGTVPNITEAAIGHQIANSKDIVLRQDDIRFEPLSDKYVVTVPVYGTNIYSLGDFVAFAGIVLAAGQVLLILFKPVRRGEPSAGETSPAGIGAPPSV
jgi:hypothetical protein